MRVLTRSTSAGDWIERDAKADSITVAHELNERSTASFTLIDPTGTTHYQRGDSVLIEYGVETIFRGFIDTATESRLGSGGTREHRIECVDLHYLADKRLVAAAYTEETAGDIVRDLITDYLADEGIEAGNISDGPSARAITFNYVTVADAIQRLANRAGFWWRINEESRLEFVDPADVAAGSITDYAEEAIDLDESALAGTISVTRQAPAYRNRQWIKGGRDSTDSQVETQLGDGERRAFLVGFPIAKEPTIEVDRGAGYVTETVGAAGIQTGRQWVYSYASNTVTQDSSETVLSSTDKLKVTYVGLFNVIARVDDIDLQAERATAEGGSGVVENVFTDRTSESRSAAFQFAAELLAYYGQAVTVVRFVTRDIDYYPGRLVTVTFDEADINAASALVTTVEWFARYDLAHAVVTLVVGPIEGSWAQWFGALSRRVAEMAEAAGGEVDVVTTLESFSKTWTAIEVPNIFYVVYPGASTFPGAAVLAAFETDDRVRFMSWYDGATEMGRKTITSQTGAATDEIVTTTVLGVSDAVGTFTHLGWWGGASASLTLGSGVEVDKQAFAFTKSDIEAIQVDKTDTKWA